jgi:hypothetical protein
MAQEQEGQLNKLRTIHVDLEQRSAQFEFEDGTVERWVYNSEGIFRSLIQTGNLEVAARQLLVTSQPEVESARAEKVDQVNEPAPARREKTPALVLPGRLKNQPSEGRPDGGGKPTAVAHFLAHMEGQEGATLLFATFHNHTRDIALRLTAGDPITAQGYYHPNRDSSRLSTFSIFHLINHPGKPASLR